MQFILTYVSIKMTKVKYSVIFAFKEGFLHAGRFHFYGKDIFPVKYFLKLIFNYKINYGFY